MAKLKIWTTHNCQRDFVLSCNAGINISNDGTVNITIPKLLAYKLGFNNLNK